jgi:D-alanyl-D-alanine carboxypeptidase (penicillin-binding protein 5/6)
VDLSTNQRFLSLPCACLLVALVASVLPDRASTSARAQRAPEVSCYACLVVDDRDRTLFARRAAIPLPNASTTKMLTALLVVARSELDAEVEVSQGAAATPGGKLSLVAGERWTVEELLQGLLLGSSNDAAVALAEAVAGSEARFVQLMNDEARRLGALHTNLATAHGLDAPGHVSTARDLVTIAKAFLDEPLLAEIVAAPSTTISSSERSVTVPNSNQLVGSYRGALGVKTGYTSQAGNVLVAAARRRGRTVIAVAMRAIDPFEDSRRLLDHGFKRLKRGILLKAMTSFGDIVFVPSGSTGVIAADSVRGINDPEKILIDFEFDPSVVPPIEPGQQLGYVLVRTRDGRIVGSAPAVATRPVGEQTKVSGMGRAMSGVLATFAKLVGEGR